MERGRENVGKEIYIKREWMKERERGRKTKR